MFMLMFLFGLISFVTAAFHLFLCCGMEMYKGDRSSPHRKKHGEMSGFTLAQHSCSFIWLTAFNGERCKQWKVHGM